MVVLISPGVEGQDGDCPNCRCASSPALFLQLVLPGRESGGRVLTDSFGRGQTSPPYSLCSRWFHPGQAVLSQRWSQPSLGKLLQEAVLRLKGPELTLGCGRVREHIQRGLCGWRKGQEWQAGREARRVRAHSARGNLSFMEGLSTGDVRPRSRRHGRIYASSCSPKSRA